MEQGVLPIDRHSTKTIPQTFRRFFIMQRVLTTVPEPHANLRIRKAQSSWILNIDWS